MSGYFKTTLAILAIAGLAILAAQLTLDAEKPTAYSVIVFVNGKTTQFKHATDYKTDEYGCSFKVEGHRLVFTGVTSVAVSE